MAITCQNGKTVLPIFYMLYSKGKSMQKSKKSCKKVGGKLSLFCLGPKTGIGHQVPRFWFSLKTFVFCSRVLRIVLIQAKKQKMCPKNFLPPFCPY